MTLKKSNDLSENSLVDSYSLFSCKTLADLVTSQIRNTLSGQYVAILLAGAAARNEITIGPNGKVLSDLDFLVVLPNKNLLQALLKEKQYRKITLEIERKVIAEYGIDISIGYANASEKYQSMATPLMLELRENALTMDGDNSVKEWPKIKSGTQIPEWEGVRLVANRICELFGIISLNLTRNSEDVLRLQYACLKLALACSEATLIFANLYKGTYLDRQRQHCFVADKFSAQCNYLIEAAYRAKLGQDLFFYSLNTQETVQDLLFCAINILDGIGIRNHSDWVKRGWSERPYHIGLGTDMLFFIKNLLRGRIVPARHAIMDVYSDATEFANKLASPNVFSCEYVRFECQNLFERFKNTPQVVSVIE